MIGLATQAAAALVGVWLMAAPAVLGYGGAAAANDRIVGPIAASIAIMAMSEVLRSVRVANVALGAWLLVAAFVLPYPGPATLNCLGAGIALIALAVPRGRTKQRYGGGWAELRNR